MKYRVLIFFLCAALSACGELGPFVDSRREAGQTQPVGQSTPNRIAVCYHPLWHTQKQVEALAQSACAQPVTYDDTIYFNCRLSAPNTAFYKCP